jgi:hypothetical protein
MESMNSQVLEGFAHAPFEGPLAAGAGVVEVTPSGDCSNPGTGLNWRRSLHRHIDGLAVVFVDKEGVEVVRRDEARSSCSSHFDELIVDCFSFMKETRRVHQRPPAGQRTSG